MKIHQAQAKNFCRVLDIRVPEVVKADAVQFGSSKNRFKGRFCPPLVERRARLRGEYQIVGIIPKRPRFDSGRSLHALLRLERIQHQGRGCECAALAVLGRDKRAVCPLIGPGKLLADGDSVTAHTIPCKPQQLGKAAPGEQGRFDKLLHFGSLCCIQQRGNLFIVHRFDFLLFKPGQRAALGGILRDVVKRDGLFQRLIQHFVS